MSFRYLLLDLDNTLYSKDSGLLQAIDNRIDEYLQVKFKWSSEKIRKNRQYYATAYGTTLSGMVLEHYINPDEYISHVYNLNVTEYIQPDQSLQQALFDIKLPKIVFSNSPSAYVWQVLETLGIAGQVSQVYDIVFNEYLGKPCLTSYYRVLNALGATGAECLLVDDVLANIVRAEQSGLTGIWLTSKELTPQVRWQIRNIYQLPEIVIQINEAEKSA